MKKLLILTCLLFVAIVAWRISERLSADAIGMALGVMFGVLAGIPTALLVLASARRREQDAAALIGRQLIPQGDHRHDKQHNDDGAEQNQLPILNQEWNHAALPVIFGPPFPAAGTSFCLSELRAPLLQWTAAGFRKPTISRPLHRQSRAIADGRADHSNAAA